MDDSLMSYIERIELMAFFVGYPLIFLLVNYFADWRNTKSNSLPKILPNLLPFAYALDGVLYLGLTLRNLFPDYSFNNIALQFQNPYLKFWGLTSVLFFLSLPRRKNYFSLVHSLVFFLLILKDFILNRTSGDKDILRNDMNIYTISLLLNTGTLLAVTIIYLIYMYIRKKNNTPPR